MLSTKVKRIDDEKVYFQAFGYEYSIDNDGTLFGSGPEGELQVGDPLEVLDAVKVWSGTTLNGYKGPDDFVLGELA